MKVEDLKIGQNVYICASYLNRASSRLYFKINSLSSVSVVETNLEYREVRVRTPKGAEMWLRDLYLREKPDISYNKHKLTKIFNQ